MSILPQIVDASDDGGRREKTRFSVSSLRRIVSLAWPFRGLLALGLLFTVLFAALHTVSISGAFPILKVFLEEEGFHGWSDRTLAGRKFGVQWTASSDQAVANLVVSKVVEAGRSDPPLLDGTLIRSVDEEVSPGGLLRQLAGTPDDGSLEVRVQRAVPDAQGVWETVTLRPVAPETEGLIDGLRAQAGRVEFGLLAWVGSVLPRGGPEAKVQTLKYVLTAVVLIVILANVFRYFAEVLISTVVLRAMVGLRTQVYQRTLLMPMPFFTAEGTAHLVTRFVQDIQEVQRGMITLFGKFIREPLRAAFLLGFAFYLNWSLTLLVMIAVPFIILIFLYVGTRVKKANKKLLQQYGHMIGALTTSLQNIRVVKAYTAEEEEGKRLRKVDWKMFRQQLKLVKLQAFTTPMMETVAAIAGSLVMVWLAGRLLGGNMDVATFGTVGFVFGVLFDPLRKLSDVYVRISRATAGADRIFQLLDSPIEADAFPAREKLAPLQSSIQFDGVTFAYPNAEGPALKDVNLTITNGETLAIVGPNGSGKTTLVSMLLRLFDPSEGTIRYDGVDLRDADLKTLREQISLVSQEAVVFGGTPVENISYGAAQPDLKRVEEAARRAHADDFINKLTGGYEAVLGERGTTLSGGQRQRLAIARAIYRDAPILIFDEATSQIDTESEEKIQDALREFSRGRTTLIIAHRLSTIQFADRIVVMDAGAIVDAGPHAELIKRCELYRTLCHTQFFDHHSGEGA